LKALGLGRPVMLVVNQTTGGTAAQACFQRLDKAARLHLGLQLYLLGYMERDGRVADALERHMPFIRLCPDSLATHHLEVIAHRLHQVAHGTRGAEGEFGAFFDALQLIDEIPERSPSRRALVKQFSELANGMDRAQLAGLLREIIARWEERNGQRFELPGASPSASATVREKTPSHMANAITSESEPETRGSHSSTEQPRAHETPHSGLQLVATTSETPRSTARSTTPAGDGLRAAASVAAKVGPL
ncbi:MAG: hypothetical protein D6720_03760, partial [Gammaproteobacteria bacterium]